MDVPFYITRSKTRLLLPLGEHDCFAEWFDKALSDSSAGVSLAFVMRHIVDDRIVGCTRLMDYNLKDSSIEIGWTIVDVEYWRSGLSRESKLLLLGYAFEQMGLTRVQITTDVNNHPNMKLLKALGANLDGILRKERRLPDGSFRDSAYFSVLADEWPEIKAAQSA
ncbi:hypothetical protein BOW52_10875 [Solemya elarraichensis gill symbiont]|uniref:N-acetyltransferase domain-containing protein n=1 Tax=Solemya elarraichensis gill symbiont TaxID=1918949 RepID=A0A1T2KTU1_9GAMM|nr:hypothetical protein BOW52_10875 [Solemya elarraichensis gill symbiont]